MTTGAVGRPDADPKAGFRWHLKDATHAQHDALDDMVSSLDLRDRADLACFFRMHLVSFAAMAAVGPSPALAAMIDALSRDLAVVSDDPATGPIPVVAPFHPLAAQYLLSGSRMGTKVLRRVWAGATDPAVRRAATYFDLAISDYSWAETCDALNLIAPDSTAARTITADTQRLFDVFAAAYVTARGHGQRPPALSEK